MAYKTCVSITETTPRRLKETLYDALKKSEYAEIRFDFLRPETVPEALQLVKKHLRRCVCTLRPKAEGGRFQGNEAERASILKLIAEYNPYLIDIEYSTLSKNKELLNYVRKTGTPILVSWHDFRKTPPFSRLAEKLQQMKKISKHVKIVTTASSVVDTTTVLSLYRKQNSNLVAFAMGDFGRISRILCLYLGSPYTYVSLGRPVAPGQFSLDEVKSLFALQK
ncbi:type I 3-dehydroquinate dehydratase [Candidatus Parcubacteria bacterium]|nr:MAG: type I 3-dehydroquinate dehydratase [Candidatus Parcubacteria bacterium]